MNQIYSIFYATHYTSGTRDPIESKYLWLTKSGTSDITKTELRFTLTIL